MGRTFHRKHYDKYNYNTDDDYESFKKHKKTNDRRNHRHHVIADKHAGVEVKNDTEDQNEMNT